jgi:hypothetical protein
MKLFYGFLTLALALVISGVAAYFSVVGLAAIFSATAGAVIVMGCALEAGKLASAGWLHQNWENSKVSNLHKSYMVAAVCALMVITALGIYGFLAHGHLAQQAPLASVELQIAQKQAQIDQINADLSRLNTQENQLDATVNAVVGQDASKGLRARGRLSSERKEIQTSIDSDNAQLNAITAQLVPLKLQISEVETKLGPIKYVADLFGIKDTEGAVRIVILILMFAFDPLAVVLVLSSAISISDGLEENRIRKLNTLVSKPDTVLDVDEVAPTNDSVGQVLPQSQPDIHMPISVSEKMVDESSNLLVELEAHPNNVKLEMSDKEKLLDILERKPELLQSVVEAVREEHAATPGPLKASWLD